MVRRVGAVRVGLARPGARPASARLPGTGPWMVPVRLWG